MTNKRLNLMLLILAIIGCLLFILLDWSDVSPANGHSITEETAILQAEKFWEQQNVPLKSDQVSATQDANVKAEGYLTKNNLQQEFEKVAPKQAPLQYWTVTFTDPKNGDAFTAKVRTDNGDVVGFSQSAKTLRNLPINERGGSQMEQALVDVGLHYAQLESPQIAEQESDDTVTYFFKVPHWQVGQMGLRYVVETKQGRVARLDTEYQLPADFTAWRDRQHTIGTLLTLLSLLLTIVMFVFAFAFLFVLKKKKRTAGAVWLTVAIFLFSLISNVNQLPVYDRASIGQAVGSVAHMVGTVVLVLLLAGLALVTALGTYPAIVTGGMLVEEVNAKLWTKWRDPSFGSNLRRAVWRGYLLAMAWLGFQQLFYWVAQHFFGVWTESDPSLSPNNFLYPALFPVMAWMAGFQEELFYRMFGVTFCKRYLKNTFLAVLLPAMVWALGHSLYPVYPAYTRFIELTIFGSIIGLCYLKFGIETVILAHLVFDSVQMCLGLMATGENGLIAAGAVLLIAPLVLGYGVSLLAPRKKRLDYRSEI